MKQDVSQENIHIILESPFHRNFRVSDDDDTIRDTPLLRVSQLYPTTKAINTPDGSIYLDQNEGEATKILSNPYYIKLSSKQTDGQFTMMEGIILPGEGEHYFNLILFQYRN